MLWIAFDENRRRSYSFYMRLDHYLSAVGIGTRSEVKKIISKGRVTVDGAVCKDAGFQVNADGSEVCCDGKKLRYREFVYFLLNKPQGIISASKADLRNPSERCVVDLIAEEQHRKLFPVGRLDKDTEGLLLITDDGKLAHNLLSPAKHVDKIYYAELGLPLSEEDRKRIEAGIDIGDETPTLPAVIERVLFTDAAGAADGTGTFCEGGSRATDLNRVYITIREGRFHQIKRMFEAVGNEVTFLKRISMGSLRLDPGLAPGEYRELTTEELQSLTGEEPEKNCSP